MAMPIFVRISPDDLPSPERQAALQERIDAVWQNARGLDDWKRDFVSSIEAQLKSQRTLTRRQREKLHELYPRNK